jgi:hypothetical protein
MLKIYPKTSFASAKHQSQEAKENLTSGRARDNVGKLRGNPMWTEKRKGKTTSSSPTSQFKKNCGC